MVRIRLVGMTAFLTCLNPVGFSQPPTHRQASVNLTQKQDNSDDSEHHR